MLNRIKQRFAQDLNPIVSRVKRELKADIDIQKVLLGRMIANQNESRREEIIHDIHKAEFSVFSQWGDDGIIQFLVNYLDIPNKSFVEFGVENYTEANTRFLLINNNWRGLIMDGSDANMSQVRASDLYWRYEITANQAFITAENINDLLTSGGFTGEIGLLHIDIDGNDYWVWKAITVVNPVIVIVEYNAVFGLDPWTIPYKADFVRTKDYMYFGASIPAFCQLGKEKGYSFVGCNTAGNNAYFVRNDKLKGLKVLTPEEGYVNSHFRESRDQYGSLTFLTGKQRLFSILGFDVLNTETGAMEKIPMIDEERGLRY